MVTLGVALLSFVALWVMTWVMDILRVVTWVMRRQLFLMTVSLMMAACVMRCMSVVLFKLRL